MPFSLGAVHKGRPQRRGKVKCGQGEGVKDLADVRKMTLFNCFAMLCRHSLWVMPIKYKLLFILSDLHHRVGPIMWAGTISYSRGKVVNYMTHISTHPL